MRLVYRACFVAAAASLGAGVAVGVAAVSKGPPTLSLAVASPQRPASSPEDLTADKAALIDALRHPPYKDLGPKPDPASARPSDEPGSDDWPEGIFTDPEAPYPSSEFVAVNRWQGALAGRKLVLYAGWMGDDPTIGRILFRSMVGTDDASSKVLSFAGEGSLHVTGVTGDIVTLVSESGQTHLFSLATGTLQ